MVFVVFAVGVGEDSESLGTRSSVSDLTLRGVPYASSASNASGCFAVSGDAGAAAMFLFFFPSAAAAVSVASHPASFEGFFARAMSSDEVRRQSTPHTTAAQDMGN